MSATKEGVLSALSSAALVIAIRLSQLALAPLYNRSFVDDARPTLLVLALLATLGLAVRRGRSVRYAALWSSAGVALASRVVRLVAGLTAAKLGGRTGAQVASFLLAGVMVGPWALCPGGPVPALVGLVLLLPKEMSFELPRVLAVDAERSLILPAIALLVIGLVSTPDIPLAPASNLRIAPPPKAARFGPRRAIISLASAVLAIALAVQHQLSRPDVPFDQSGVTVHSSTQSVSGRVVVEDVDLGEHTMRVLRADHSLVGGLWLMPDDRGGTELGDSVFSAFPLQEIGLFANRSTPPGNLLVIGLGVGIGAQHYAKQGYSVDIVEYDPAVVAAAQAYFGLGSVPIHEIAVEDAVGFVSRRAELAAHSETERRYDLLVHDVFSAGSLYPALFTVGFWENAREIMVPDGIVVMNVAAHPDSEHLRPLAAALQAVFPHCRAFHDLWSRDIGEDDMVNLVLLCSGEPIELRSHTARDTRGSYLREHVYGTYARYELDMNRILPPDVDREELALRDGNEWRATRGQSVLADRTWPIIQKLMRDDQWVVY